MKNKKWFLVGLITIILTLIFIRKIHTTIQIKETQKQIKDAEQNISLLLVQNFEDIQKIDFGKMTQSKNTGFWHVTVFVNEKSWINFSLRNLSDKEDITYGYRPNSFYLIEKTTSDKTNLDDIVIKYSNEE